MWREYQSANRPKEHTEHYRFVKRFEPVFDNYQQGDEHIFDLGDTIAIRVKDRDERSLILFIDPNTGEINQEYRGVRIGNGPLPGDTADVRHWDIENAFKMKSGKLVVFDEYYVHILNSKGERLGDPLQIKISNKNYRNAYGKAVSDLKPVELSDGTIVIVSHTARNESFQVHFIAPDNSSLKTVDVNKNHYQKNHESNRTRKLLASSNAHHWSGQNIIFRL